MNRFQQNDKQSTSPENDTHGGAPQSDGRDSKIALLAAVAVAMQWISQPPLALWWVAPVAVVAWLFLAFPIGESTMSRRGYVLVWLMGTLYWLVSLQGLRHAHPLMIVCLFALAAYLSVYGALFLVVCRRFVQWKIPRWIAAPVAWVGLECVRNYFATGISAAMLGHTMADVPIMIQIADTFGSYGVSFVVVMMNVALFECLRTYLTREKIATVAVPVLAAIGVVVATLAYGAYRLNQPTGERLATFALIQRSEPVEYAQDEQREREIFRSYALLSMKTLENTSEKVDVVVWPESMFSGGQVWRTEGENMIPPEQFEGSLAEFKMNLEYFQREYLSNALDLQTALASVQPSRESPHIMGGCGVVRYEENAQLFSGVVHVDDQNKMANWYGKTHLVMFGEYIPIASMIPGLKSILPHLTLGDGPKRFVVGDCTVAPNICIETAVERVTVNQMSELHSDGGLPDVIVTVTNDGWFDDSSVIDHHLRCAQFVAVGCRRPILSAANNGPTAWIDGRGRIVERLATGSAGSIIASPQSETQVSAYVMIGDWPARFLAILCVASLIAVAKDRWHNRCMARAATPCE